MLPTAANLERLNTIQSEWVDIANHLTAARNLYESFELDRRAPSSHACLLASRDVADLISNGDLRQAHQKLYRLGQSYPPGSLPLFWYHMAQAAHGMLALC